MPAMFWHIQKSGGTAMCQMSVDELRFRKCDLHSAVQRKGGRPDCSGNYGLPDGKSTRGFQLLVGGVNPRKIINAIQYSKFTMLDMEPADRFSKDFPASYHEYMRPVLSNNETGPGPIPAVHPLWTSVPHIIALRDPLKASMSTMHYGFAMYKLQPDKYIRFRGDWDKEGVMTNILTACTLKKISIKGCINLMFTVREGETHPNIWGEYHEMKIRTQVLGNFITMHLSATEDLEEAKRNLERFALVLDLTDRERHDRCVRLMQCTLGWHTTSFIRAANVQSHTDELSDYFTEEQQVQLRKYLAKDIELYEYGMSLMDKHDEARASRSKSSNRSVLLDTSSAEARSKSSSTLVGRG